MGRFGLPVNIAALCYLAIVFVICFFPPVPLPALDAASMNWSSAIFVLASFCSMLYYFIQGRYSYLGPVKYVQKEVLEPVRQ